MKAPLTLPDACFAMQEFELQRIDYAAPEAGGRVNGVQAGFPLWSAVWTLSNMGRDKSDEVRAFWAQIRGATRRFIGRDVTRRYPKAYSDGFEGLSRAGGGSFDGTADDWSESITADGDSQVTLENLPEGFVLNVGDYIGFSWTATETSVAGLPWHACVRVVEGGTADGEGHITVTSEPPIPSAVPDDATAYLNEPACVMALIIGQSSLNAVEPGFFMQGGQFTAIQDIRA